MTDIDISNRVIECEFVKTCTLYLYKNCYERTIINYLFDVVIIIIFKTLI